MLCGEILFKGHQEWRPVYKKELVQKTQSTWKSEGYAKDKKKIDIRYQYTQMSPTASLLYV